MLKLIKSLLHSIRRAIIKDPELHRLCEKYPRISRFIRNRFTPDERFGWYLTLGVLVTLFFVYLFFGVVQDYLGQEAIIASDLRVINLLQIFRSVKFTNLMVAFTYLGEWQVVFLGVFLLGIILALANKWRYLYALVFSVAGGEAFVWLFKHLIKRSRPPLIHALTIETSYSFPSGHAFVAVAFYGLLSYFLITHVFKKQYLKAITFILGVAIIALISFSRIYLGAHWPSDVLASLASGFAWTAMVITALEIWRKDKRVVHRRPAVSIKIISGLSAFFLVGWLAYYSYLERTHLAPEIPPIDSQKIVLNDCEQIPTKGFDKFSKYSETMTGKPMEPINIIVVGSEEKINEVFYSAKWVKMDQVGLKSWLRFAESLLLSKPYPEAPGIPSFWNVYPNDFAYEQLTEKNIATERHHIHFWKTPFICDGEPVFYGTAHYDQSIQQIGFGLIPVHEIDPAVDKEREKIKNDLLATNLVNDSYQFSIVGPTLGKNSVGSLFFTDGKAEVFKLR